MPPYQLPDGDAIFLSMETPEAGGHIGSLSILDPSQAPGFDYERLARFIEDRLRFVPRFTWKLRQVPLGLDRPYWVENPAFRARDHIHRIALPAPGGDAELAEMAGQLHALPLDRSRALWQAWIIGGLAGGRYALYLKVHHCLMDGASGTGLGEVIADLTPDATQPLVVPAVYDEPTPASPSTLDLLVNAVKNVRGRRRAFLGHAFRGLREVAQATRGDSAEGVAAEVPRLAFNKAIGRRRAFAWASLPFEPMRDLKKHFDVKLNDVLLAVVAGAMRRYLRERGELPLQPLLALCPVATRQGDDLKLENQITQMSVSLATDSADPALRLRRIHASANRAKQSVAGGHFDIMAAVSESLAPGAVGLIIKAANLAGDTGPLPGNFVVSNVRATPMPLYMAGARIESLMPLSLLQVGQGLNITMVSYCDRIDIGLTLDPDLLPDPWALAECFEPALEELESAAEGVLRRAG